MKIGVFFDIDGTLIRTVTQNELTKVLLREKIISRWRGAEIAVWFILYKLGLLTNTVPLRKKAYGLFRGASHADILDMCNKVWRENVQNSIRPDMVNIAEEHRAKGHLLFAISGSIRELCAPICAQFGIQNFYATNLHVENGTFTGTWDGAILEGAAKVDLMRRIAKEEGIDLTQSFAYADSYSDRPMLEAVGRPAAVTPDMRLGKIARERGWTILD